MWERRFASLTQQKSRTERRVLAVTERSIREFWNSYPCDDQNSGGPGTSYDEFFRRYDTLRYSRARQEHILDCLDGIDFCGKRVLEIGLGQGAESEQIIRRGAIWSGIDLTPESVARVRARLSLRQLPHERLELGSALRLPFTAASFDIVFSHGVLHHIPEIGVAQTEIARVLKPGGELVAMLYAKFSLNYLVAISVVRRLTLIVRYLAGSRRGGETGRHLAIARRIGLPNYLRMRNFIHCATDGALNPYAKVYDLATVRKDFPSFKVTRHYRRYMVAHPLPVAWLPLDRLLGWHLWVHMKPRDP
jgi:SAM-dependent methyltransferase